MVEEGEVLSEAELLELEQLADGRVLIDATEQQVYRPGQDNEERKKYYSGKKKQFTRKTQFATDGEWDIKAISVSVPGAKSDKKLSDELKTVERAPAGSEMEADKGYQGLAKQVEMVTVRNIETGQEEQVPRLTVNTPFKKPKGGDLSEEQKAFNKALGSIRVRVEHCIGWVKNWATLTRQADLIHLGIRWQTNALTELNIPRPQRGGKSQRTPTSVIDRIRLLAATHTDRQIAVTLNQEKLTARYGEPFTAEKVQFIRHKYAIATDCPESPRHCPTGQRADGRYCSRAAAELLNVCDSTILRWCRRGRLESIQSVPNGPRWITLTPELIAKLRQP